MSEILLNIMYAGAYIENDNIGHEIINLFKSDNGKNYIYAMPYGTVAESHNDKIKSVLLVRRCSANTLEVLAKTDGKLKQRLMESFGRTDKNKEKAKARDIQVKEIQDEKITYGGKYLHEIFGKNNTNDRDIYITFEAEHVVKPKEPIYLTTDEKLIGQKNYYFLSDIQFPRQSMKGYLSTETNKANYDLVMDKIINNADLWGERTRKVKIRSLNEKDEEMTFLKIIGKEYDELSYSNMLAYFFQYAPETFCRFAKDVLGMDFNTDFTIAREQNNIDLLITDEQNVLVIENKIKSGINGIKDKDEIDNNQLLKYRDYVYEQFPIQKKKFFVLLPNYSHIDLEMLDKSKEYKTINYSELFAFYQEQAAQFKEIKFFFNEFITALKKQSVMVDNSLEDEMYRRFSKTIKEA